MIKPGRVPDYRDRDYARREPERKAVVAKGAAVPAVAPKNMFEKYEQVMQESFRSLCEAVATIKNKFLYRQVGYDTFEECCEQRWGFSARHGYRLAEGNATLKSLPKSVTKLVTNEGQVRAIATVPKEQRVEILKKVAKEGPVTAKAIAEAFRPAEPVVIDVEPEVKESQVSKHPCPMCRCE